MSRLFATAALIAAVTVTSGFAQDLPSPAAEGQGQSTQTIDLVKDAVVVTIDAGGSFSTRSGESQGGFSVDVNGFSVGVGSGAGNAPGAGPAKGGNNGSTAGSKASGNGETPSSGNHAAAGQGAAARDDATCGGEAGAAVSVEDIERLGAGAPILLQPNCEALALDDASQRAMAGNVGLVQLLKANGIDPGDVVSLTMVRDTVVIGHRAAD